MSRESDQAPAQLPASVPSPAPRGRPVVVPHIDFDTPVNENDLVSAHTGFGLTRPS